VVYRRCYCAPHTVRATYSWLYCGPTLYFSLYRHLERKARFVRHRLPSLAFYLPVHLAGRTLCAGLMKIGIAEHGVFCSELARSTLYLRLLAGGLSWGVAFMHVTIYGRPLGAAAWDASQRCQASTKLVIETGHPLAIADPEHPPVTYAAAYSGPTSTLTAGDRMDGWRRPWQGARILVMSRRTLVGRASAPRQLPLTCHCELLPHPTGALTTLRSYFSGPTLHLAPALLRRHRRGAISGVRPCRKTLQQLAVASPAAQMMQLLDPISGSPWSKAAYGVLFPNKKVENEACVMPPIKLINWLRR